MNILEKPPLIKCKRLKKKTYDARIVKRRNGTLVINNTDGTSSPMKILRPQPSSPELVDTYMSSDDQDPNNHTYKFFQPVEVAKLWNTAIKEHKNCSGTLHFDGKNAQKWGASWRERLVCFTCNYKSKYHSMYEEHETTKRGRKGSKLNTRLQNALVTTPISNQSLINILLQCNIIPPSYSAMQKTANKICSEIVRINRISMKNIRETIKQENEDCGLSDPNLVRAEGDGRYNNPMFKGDTPFQAGTQVTYVMCENNSNLKRIISVFTGNKLCTTASKLRNKGHEVVCPNHSGTCTANIAQDESIGNEYKWSSECAQEVNDTLIISHFTTDGDSKAIIGVRNAKKKMSKQ